MDKKEEWSTKITSNRRRFLKTISYRISATGIFQIIIWLVSKKWEYNVIALLTDLGQSFWYYIHEWIWN